MSALKKVRNNKWNVVTWLRLERGVGNRRRLTPWYWWLSAGCDAYRLPCWHAVAAKTGGLLCIHVGPEVWTFTAGGYRNNAARGG